MRVVRGPSNEDEKKFLLGWMKERIKGWDISYDKDVRIIYLAEENEGQPTEIIACVALNRWTNGSVELHMATDLSHRWLTPEFTYEVYGYIFNTCKMARINLLVHVNNIASLKTQHKLGHTELCRIKHGYGHGEDAILFGYTIEDYLEGKWSKAPPSTQQQ